MNHKPFTEEFKIEAVRQVIERGFAVKEIAARLGVSTWSLYQWIKRYGIPAKKRLAQEDQVGKQRGLDTSNPLDRMLDDLERTKARTRSKVEHPFRVAKRQFGHVSARYRGFMRNTQQLFTLFPLSNLCMLRQRLLHRAGKIGPACILLFMQHRQG
jgi:transposase-like protein